MLMNRQAPLFNEILGTCRWLWKSNGEEAVLAYLEEIATYDFTDTWEIRIWAIDFFEDNVEYIMSMKTLLTIV